MFRRPPPVALILGGFVLVFLILPNLIILPMSLSPSEFYFEFPPRDLTIRWYEAFFSDPRWIEALIRSIGIGLAVAMLSVVFGGLSAFALTRGRFADMPLISGLLFAPLIVPHVILAASFYVQFARIGLLNTQLGLILAHTVLATPIVAITVMASLKNVQRDLELAAMSLGAGYLTTFGSVVLPQVMPGILTGAILAFITSFDELVVAVFLGGVQTTTLPMKMWEGILVESNPILPAASTILVTLSTLPWLIIELAKRKSTAANR